MVSILPSERTPYDLIGRAIGQNLNQHLPGAVQQGYNRGLLQEGLGKIKDLAKNPGTSPLDIMLAAMQAGAGIPGSERYLGQIIPELAKFARAGAEQNIQYPGEQPGQPLQQPERQQLPGFMQQPGQPQSQGQPSQFFPTNIGPQQEPGNLPQAATTGEVIPLLTRSQKIPEARKLQKESTAAGIPMTMKEAMDQVNASEEDKKEHNKLVEEERKQRVVAQKTYGERAVDYLGKYYDNATPEMQAIFQQKGEQVAARGKSEGEINQTLANEAKKFANTIANAEKDVSAPRLYNALSRAVNGNYKDFEAAAQDVRKHLQPILDLGLYDTARKILQDKGYGIEEREMIINPLNDRSKTILNRVPEVKASPFQRSEAGLNFQRSPVDLNNIKKGLLDLKQSDPNFSLALARKSFEDKGYNWREFKDALNELVNEGFEYTDDQRNQSGAMDQPPLGALSKILQGIGVIGR